MQALQRNQVDKLYQKIMREEEEAAFQADLLANDVNRLSESFMRKDAEERIAMQSVHLRGYREGVEMTFERFCKLYPELAGARPTLHPSTVWTEIITNIKGAPNQLELVCPATDRKRYELYVASSEHDLTFKDTVWGLYKRYEEWRRRRVRNAGRGVQLSYDFCDVVAYIYDQLRLEGRC
jgi:hypothetical protein